MISKFIFIKANAKINSNLFRGIRQVDGGVFVAGRHLRLGAQQGRDEGGVDQAGFLELQSRSNVSRHSEVRILGRI